MITNHINEQSFIYSAVESCQLASESVPLYIISTFKLLAPIVRVLGIIAAVINPHTYSVRTIA